MVQHYNNYTTQLHRKQDVLRTIPYRYVAAFLLLFCPAACVIPLYQVKSDKIKTPYDVVALLPRPRSSLPQQFLFSLRAGTSDTMGPSLSSPHPSEVQPSFIPPRYLYLLRNEKIKEATPLSRHLPCLHRHTKPPLPSFVSLTQASSKFSLAPRDRFDHSLAQMNALACSLLGHDTREQALLLGSLSSAQEGIMALEWPQSQNSDNKEVDKAPGCVAQFQKARCT